jgi:hypothetical protein
MSNVAVCYRNLGRYPEALKLHQETLTLREARLGPDHPDTLRSMWLVAASLSNVDRGAEAVPMIDECLKRAVGKSVPPRFIPSMMGLRMRQSDKAKDAAGWRDGRDVREAEADRRE